MLVCTVGPTSFGKRIKFLVILYIAFTVQRDLLNHKIEFITIQKKLFVNGSNESCFLYAYMGKLSQFLGLIVCVWFQMGTLCLYFARHWSRR